MDEATLKRLAGLVKSMHDQGLAVDQIKENLEQMGIAKDDISLIISEAGLMPNTVDVHKEVSALREAMETGQAVKPVVEKLGETEDHFERLHTKVDLLHEKHGEIEARLEDLAELKAEIAEVKQLLLEIKPVVMAIKKLQEDLLEVSRSILARESVK